MISAEPYGPELSSIRDVSRVRHSGSGLARLIVRTRFGRFRELTSAMNVRLNQAQVPSGAARRAATVALWLLAQITVSAHAGPSEQAKRIYERVAGEPPPASALTQMSAAITATPGQQGLLNAAAIATSAASFYNGTNRAMFRFTMINHLCHDMETVMDITRPADRIRQDVARSPGGDSRLFLNNCVGCHSGMDPMAQAFAYYNFDATAGQLVYTANQVQPKYLINSANFPFGFVTPDDSWSNRWRAGANASLGWDPALPGGGAGAKSLGQELASSDAFAQCQVTKVFQAVCFRASVSAAD